MPIIRKYDPPTSTRGVIYCNFFLFAVIISNFCYDLQFNRVVVAFVWKNWSARNFANSRVTHFMRLYQFYDKLFATCALSFRNSKCGRRGSWIKTFIALFLMLDLIFIFNLDAPLFHLSTSVGGVFFFYINWQAFSPITWSLCIYYAIAVTTPALHCVFFKFFYLGLAACCYFILIFARAHKFFIYEQLAVQLNLSIQIEFLNLLIFAESLWFNFFIFCNVGVCNLLDFGGLFKLLSEAIVYFFTTSGAELLSFYSVTVTHAFWYYAQLFMQENLLQINIWLRLGLLGLRFCCYQLMDETLCLFEVTAAHVLPGYFLATGVMTTYSHIFAFYVICGKFLIELDLVFKCALLLNMSYILLLILQRFGVMENIE